MLRYLYLLLTVLVVCITCADRGVCAKSGDEAKLVIPDYPSAKQQFEFALMYEKSQFLSTEKKMRREQIGKVSQCYKRVIESFPQDTMYTPRAYLHLGDAQAKIGDADAAIQFYQMVINNTACQDEFLQARSQFGVAQMLDAKQDFARAKALYKEIMDQYGASNNGAVRQITKQASVAYFTVHEEPKQSKWSLKRLLPGSKGTSKN